MNERSLPPSENDLGQGPATEKTPRPVESVIEDQSTLRKLFDLAKTSESGARQLPIEEEMYALLNEMTKGELAKEVDPVIAKADLIGLSKMGQLYKDAVARKYAAKFSEQSGIDPYRKFYLSESYWAGVADSLCGKIIEASDRGYLLGRKGRSRSKKESS